MNKGNVITRRLHRCICVYIWCRCRVYIKISFWMKTCVELCVRIFLCVFTSFLFVILCIQIHYINTFSLCSNNVNQTQEMNKKKIIFIGVLHWFSWLVLKGFLSFSFSFFCCSILVSFQCFTTKHIQHKKKTHLIIIIIVIIQWITWISQLGLCQCNDYCFELKK